MEQAKIVDTLECISALSACHRENFVMILSSNLVASPKVISIKVPPAVESKRFLETKFNPA